MGRRGGKGTGTNRGIYDTVNEGHLESLMKSNTISHTYKRLEEDKNNLKNETKKLEARLKSGGETEAIPGLLDPSRRAKGS